MKYYYDAEEKKLEIYHDTDEEKERKNKTTWRGFEIAITQKWSSVDSTETIDITKPGEGSFELKTCQKEYKDGRSGCFNFVRHQHKKVEYNDGNYILLLRGEVNGTKSRLYDCVSVPVNEITEIIHKNNRRWSYDSNDDRYIVKIPWTNIPHVDTRKSNPSIIPE